MSRRDQRACLPSQCISSPDTFPSPAPSKILEPPLRRSGSKARANIRATQRKSKDCDRVKPPANGFLLFRSEYVSNPAHQFSGDGSRKRQVDLTREAGVAWRRLSQAERDIYRDTARQNMEEHKARHPDYWTSRRGRDGKYMRADPEREQGSPVKASHGMHEAVLSGDLSSESAAPTAAPSPSCDAPSPCPSLASSASDDDCPTPRAPSQQSSLPAVAGPSLEQPSLDGSQPYGFSDFIHGSQFLPIDAPPIPPWWFPGASLSTDLCAGLDASTGSIEPMYGVSYEDWAFVEGEEFFHDGAKALDDITIPLVGFLISQDAPLDA